MELQMNPYLLLALLASVSASTHFSGYTKSGLDFFVLGDYSWPEDDMAAAKATFAAMEALVGSADNETNPYDLVDLMFLTGGNVFPEVAEQPSDEELKKTLELFQTENLKNLELYAVRGESEVGFDPAIEQELSQNYSKWHMPSLYYEEEFEVGENGEKLSVLFIDSYLLLCSLYDNRDYWPYFPSQFCGKDGREAGREQYKWILRRLDSWKRDSHIAWRATVLHHTLFGKGVHDQTQLIDNLLPLLYEHDVDFYFAGHENVLALSKVAQSQSDYDSETTLQEQLPPFDCRLDVEMHFSNVGSYEEVEKGAYFYHVTSGVGGRPGQELCAQQPSAGRFSYAQNIYNGWVQVHLEAEEAVLQVRGVDADTGDVVDLYEARIAKKQAQA